MGLEGSRGGRWRWSQRPRLGGLGTLRNHPVLTTTYLYAISFCLTCSVQTDSTAFYDSLFANASTWGLMTAKHDHVSDNIPAVPAALEELGYLGRVLSAEHDGLVRS